MRTCVIFAETKAGHRCLRVRACVQGAAVAWIVVRVAPSVREAIPCLKGAPDKSQQCNALHRYLCGIV
jgi:hypothetical protein